jgi:ataxin-10
MSVQEAETVLNSTLLNVKSHDSSDAALNRELEALGRLVQASLQSEQLRRELSQRELIWRLIRANLEVKLFQDGLLSIKSRLLRGVVLLGRNLLSMDRDIAERLQIRQAVFQYLDQLETLEMEPKLFEDSVVSSFQLLSNLTVNKSSHDRSLLGELVEFYKRKTVWSDEVSFTVWSYMNNIFDDSDLLYEALSKGKGRIIMISLLEEFEKLNLETDLDRNGLLLVKIFYKLIIHGSFQKFTITHNEPDVTVRFLKVATTLITSKKSWEIFELTVILSWTWELFQKTLLEVQTYFKEKPNMEPTFMYQKMLAVLDCISSLVHFEHARKFLLSYKGIETLVSLLGTLHQNIKPKKLKDTERQSHSKSQVVEYHNFPHIKSMIIETLSSLIYQNFDAQELMREIHGLELVLSNCIIDDNEPFIKERSIVCLRFLLLNNQKNQEFVSKLEAREAVNDDTLEKAGFEVKIIDGKVKLNQKEKIEELQ